MTYGSISIAHELGQPLSGGTGGFSKQECFMETFGINNPHWYSCSEMSLFVCIL